MTKVYVTPEQVPALVRAAYDLSVPVGLGFLHFRPGPMTDDLLRQVLAQVKDAVDYSTAILYMDYVAGRCCKFGVFTEQETGRFYIENPWFDHTEEQFDELCNRAGVSRVGQA